MKPNVKLAIMIPKVTQPSEKFKQIIHQWIHTFTTKPIP